MRVIFEACDVTRRWTRQLAGRARGEARLKPSRGVAHAEHHARAGGEIQVREAVDREHAIPRARGRFGERPRRHAGDEDRTRGHDSPNRRRAAAGETTYR